MFHNQGSLVGIHFLLRLPRLRGVYGELRHQSIAVYGSGKRRSRPFRGTASMKYLLPGDPTRQGTPLA